MPISQAALIALCILGAGYLILKFGRALGAILVVLCLLCAGVWTLVHSFTTFSEQTLVAQVHASEAANQPHTMTVDLTTYSVDGTPTTETYELGGDMWFLQSQSVEFQPWIALFGARGYHLSRISGEYTADQPNSTPVQLGTRTTDNWFTLLENNVKLFWPLVKSAYGSGVIEVADGRTYDVYVDNSGGLSVNRA